MGAQSAKAGDWVEIERVILTPAERAPTVPEDTKKTPYIMRVSGFAVKAAKLGDELEVRTLIGRHLSGKLVTLNPSYTHSFGAAVPEVLRIATAEEPEL